MSSVDGNARAPPPIQMGTLDREDLLQLTNSLTAQLQAAEERHQIELADLRVRVQAQLDQCKSESEEAVRQLLATNKQLKEEIRKLRQSDLLKKDNKNTVGTSAARKNGAPSKRKKLHHGGPDVSHAAHSTNTSTHATASTSAVLITDTNTDAQQRVENMDAEIDNNMFDNGETLQVAGNGKCNNRVIPAVKITPINVEGIKKERCAAIRDALRANFTPEQITFQTLKDSIRIFPRTEEIKGKVRDYLALENLGYNSFNNALTKKKAFILKRLESGTEQYNVEIITEAQHI